MPHVAIVGLGPKGLFALERLLSHAGGLADGARVDVDVFEPHPAAGAGPNYDPEQPAYLRMNFAAGVLDMWPPAGARVPAGERPSFAAWRDRLPGGGDIADYPPRAQVGRYLTDGLASVLRHAPSSVRVTQHRTRVHAVRRSGERWDVVAADGAARRYDEVLLATGHEQSWDDGLARDWAHPATLVPSVFPVQRWLSPQRVAPGAVVAVRGFALTFIDAALALTEGRGGSFQALEHPYRLRYVRGDEDVRVIMPFSRSGRAMLAKPDRAVSADVPELAAVADQGREQILGLADGFDAHRDLLPVLADTAADALRAARGASERQGDDHVALRRWLAAAAAGRPPAAGADPAEDLERSLAVGAGLREPDTQWALGHAWRALYPALVLRLGGDGLAASQWPLFRALAAEMERVAFGPAAVNVAKLLALIDAGRVDLSHVSGPDLRTRGGRTYLCSENGERAIDAVVDAVLPGPGASRVHGEPLRRLLHDGHLRVAPGRRGLDVDAAGACRGADGTVSRGLSAIGRATEDVVIGNDTLSRTLHPLADQWALKVILRCREPRTLMVAGAPRADCG